MRLPLPRGPLSHALTAALRDEAPVPVRVGAVDEEDLQVSLWALYEQHYRGFEEVDPFLEWDPALLALRQSLEQRFEGALRRRAGGLVERASESGRTIVEQLQWLADREGPGLPAYLHREATPAQWAEFLSLRSVYHLKESDPQAWVVPRIAGGAKAALAELQYDEFGDGVGERVHQELFAAALAGAGLDPAYGAYVNDAPAHVLAASNAMSLFGLHRRLRGAALGNLAAFEMTSSLPCRRYAQGAQRVGLAAAVAYYEEHVEADAVHEQLAARSICGRLAEDEPDLREDVLFGAAVCVVLEHDSGERMLSEWAEGGSALRPRPRRAVA